MRNKSHKLVIILAIVIALVMVFWAVLTFLFRGDLPYISYHMMNGWMMPFGMILMVFVWIVFVYFLFQLFDGRKTDLKEKSLITLKERLSKGEISIEEYESIYKKIKEDIE